MSGQLRLVGGKWKGSVIEAPRGRSTTRPSTDRTRERIASMVLSSFDLDLSQVCLLDAFAGSGALGLELVSRGAAQACFVDSDRAAYAVIKRNIAKLGAENQTQVIAGDIWALAQRGHLLGAPFNLVLLDPPYAVRAKRVAQLLEELDRHGLLLPDARIIYEHAAATEGLSLEKASLEKAKKQGIIAVDLLVYR